MCDNKLRLYLDGATQVCEKCPVNQNINNNPANRSCDDNDNSTLHQEWNETISQYECVPGYFRSSKICEPCALGQYQDELEQSSCKMCPGNSKTRHTASISSNNCAFCVHDRRLVQSENTGVFECVKCSTCTMVSHNVHMQQTAFQSCSIDCHASVVATIGRLCFTEFRRRHARSRPYRNGSGLH